MTGETIEWLTRNVLRRIIHSTVEQQKSGCATEIFQRSWASLLSNPFYRLAMRMYVSDKKNFCLNTESLKFLVRTQPEFFQSIKISAPPDFMHELRKNTSFVAVQIHDGSPNLSKFLVDHKRPFSRIVRNPARHLKRLRAMQVDTSYVNLIERDVRCFSRLRTAVRNGHIICCAIDYKNESGKRVYLNPAIFGFAKQLMLPVIFIKNDIDHMGCVHIRASKPHTVSESTLSALAFQEFYNSMPSKKIDMTVKRYYE